MSITGFFIIDLLMIYILIVFAVIFKTIGPKKLLLLSKAILLKKLTNDRFYPYYTIIIMMLIFFAYPVFYFDIYYHDKIKYFKEHNDRNWIKLSNKTKCSKCKFKEIKIKYRKVTKYDLTREFFIKTCKRCKYEWEDDIKISYGRQDK